MPQYPLDFAIPESVCFLFLRDRCHKIWVREIPTYLSDSIRINRPCSPVCPQANHKSLEEDLLGLHESEIPRQVFKQDEFECLNLNVTCPGQLKPGSRLPVMLWIHGYVTAPFECGFLYLHLFILVEEAIAVRVPAGCMMEQG